MSTQTVRLKIQQLILLASLVSHTAVTAFCHTIILMITTAILPRLNKTVNSTNKYVYDSFNELKEEYDYVNKFYINYSYDGAGNLQNKYEQVLDPTYGYPTGTQNGNTYEYTDTQVLCTFNLCKIRVLFAIVDSIQLELLGVMSFFVVT